MAKKSSGFIFSWPMIVALIFGYNMFFGDDEKDNKTISVEVEQVEVTDKPSLDDRINNLVEKGVTIVEDGVAVLEEKIESVDKALQEAEKEEPKVDETQDIKKEKEEVAKKEKKVETIRPLELDKEKPKNEIGMKKL